MESEKSTLAKRALSIRPFVFIAGLVLVPVGIGFLCTVYTTDSVTAEQEYFQNCKDKDFFYKCNGTWTYENRTYDKCGCIWDFNITQDIIGDITLYYELESFDQTDPSYANSRDNDQLSGHTSKDPSPDCGQFRYDQDKPIFPCGRVADSMFNDTFASITQVTGPDNISKPIPITYEGVLIEDTIPFHNPPAEALANFTKPKNWRSISHNTWDTVTGIAGVENPLFRAWMNTNLKRKPVLKVAINNTLPAGAYLMEIDILYQSQAYNGRRIFIIEGVYTVSRLSHVVIGSVALMIGIIALVSAAVLIFIGKRQGNPSSRSSSYNASTLPVTDRISHGPRSHEYEDISEEAKLNKNH